MSPILVLGGEDNVSLIAVLAFLLIIGGVFNCLEKCGLMKYMLDKITHHYGKERYKLMALISLFFMAMGAFIGSFEECVPLVPIVVALAVGVFHVMPLYILLFTAVAGYLYGKFLR